MPLQSGGGFLWLAVVFLVLAVVAGLLGARGVAGFSMEIARILVIVFIILAVVTFLILGGYPPAVGCSIPRPSDPRAGR